MTEPSKEVFMSTSLNTVVDFFDAVWSTYPTATGQNEWISDSYLIDLPTTYRDSTKGLYKWNGMFDDLVQRFDRVYDSNFPPMNLYIDTASKDVLFEFAVAGVPRDHINISVEDDNLIVSTDKVNSEREGMKMIQNGLKRSKTTNKYYVPASRYQLDNIIAKIEDGVLSIRVPAREEVRPRQIEIE